MNEFTDLCLLVEAAKKDAADFIEKGNKTAGTRLRAKMQEIKVLAQKVREAVSQAKNA